MPTTLKIAIGTTTSDALPTGPANLTHRMYHLSVFAIAALLRLLLAPSGNQEIRESLGLIALGTIIELTQHFVMGNPILEWWDIRDDAIGVLAALIIIQWKIIRDLVIAEPHLTMRT